MATCRVTDCCNETFEADDRCRIVQILTETLDDATVGEEYSFQLDAFGGTTPYTWALADGTLPTGLTLSSTGLISGTPTEDGDFEFTIKQTDANGNSCEQDFTLTVNPAPDMPLNDAIYESGRDLIFAVNEGRIFKLNATTGRAIAQAVYAVPSIGDCYVTYVSSLDKLFASSWLYLDTFGGTASEYNLFRIDPDTLAVEASFKVPGGAGTGSGPKHILSNGTDVFGVYTFGGSATERLWRLNTGTSAFTNGISIGWHSIYGVICRDTDTGGIWMGRAAAGSGATSFSVPGLAAGTFVELSVTSATLPTAVAYRSSFLYFTNAQRSDITPQFVLKKKSDNTGVITSIDTGRANALPFNIGYNSTNDRIYVPTFRDNTVVIIDPTTDTVESVKTGFDCPFDVVFTPTKAFAVQHSAVGLLEIT